MFRQARIESVLTENMTRLMEHRRNNLVEIAQWSVPNMHKRCTGAYPSIRPTQKFGAVSLRPVRGSRREHLPIDCKQVVGGGDAHSLHFSPCIMHREKKDLIAFQLPFATISSQKDRIYDGLQDATHKVSGYQYLPLSSGQVMELSCPCRSELSSEHTGKNNICCLAQCNGGSICSAGHFSAAVLSSNIVLLHILHDADWHYYLDDALLLLF